MGIEPITEEAPDDSPWSPDEMAILAGIAFGALDNTDYSEYLRDNP